MATDRASRKREKSTRRQEPYVSWKVDFFVLFAVAVAGAGVLTSVLVL
jgi:hypothetical protein